jgi:GAF domain-containing protein
MDCIPSAGFAGFMLATGQQVSIPAGSERIVAALDSTEYETQQGPTLSAAREWIAVRGDDLGTDPRWPDFGSRAAGLGVRSALALPVFVHDRRIGVLSLYAADPEAFNDEDETIGLLLAAVAAVALAGAEEHHHLLAAISRRDTIGQAKGILMERYRITDVAAFAVLVKASQRTNRKLRDVALTVADTLQDPATIRPGR